MPFLLSSSDPASGGPDLKAAGGPRSAGWPLSLDIRRACVNSYRWGDLGAGEKKLRDVLGKKRSHITPGDWLLSAGRKTKRRNAMTECLQYCSVRDLWRGWPRGAWCPGMRARTGRRCHPPPGSSDSGWAEEVIHRQGFMHRDDSLARLPNTIRYRWIFLQPGKTCLRLIKLK